VLVVVVPLALLFVVVFVKKIPYVGGDIRAALLITALASGLIAGLAPVDYVIGAVDGIDQLSWVIMLSLFGSIYAETQVRLGAVDTTLGSLRSLFGNTPKGLIAAVFLTLVLAGSLLGDAIAAATVIGFLVIHALHDMGIKPNQIGMIILLGASLGSIMPPISQAVFLSASLADTNPEPVLAVAYATVAVGLVFAVVESFRFVRGKQLPEELRTTESAVTILRHRWKTLLPLVVLAAIVVANSGFAFNVFESTPGVGSVTEWMLSVPVVQGIAFPVVLAIIVATLISFGFGSVRQDTLGTVRAGLSKVSKTVQIQLCAGVMVGMFYASGAIDLVAEAAASANGSALKLGGALGITGVGMLTGSQTTAQTVMVPFLAPVLQSLDVGNTALALGASHIAAAGQNLPPVSLTAFVVAGLISGALNQRVDPLKVMVLAVPNSCYFVAVGLVAWFI